MIQRPAQLARLRPGVQRGRASTWDRSGGNDDFISLAPGETAVLAEADGPGQITHLWCTLLSPDLWWGRSLVLRAYWDGEATPSVEAPLGDLFGSGNCLTAMYSSALVEAAPRDGLSLHCWAPMPYADGFRITVTNDGPLPVLAFYAYVDYERWPRPDPELARFHAWWHRERRTHPLPAAGTYAPGVNLSGADNYLLLDTSGRGHYVGACLYVQSEDGGWYGEGDDMIFIDGEGWPPSVHGTGTEDYLGTAWSPATAFSHPYYGQPVAEREDWAGFSNLYRFHIADPIPFARSLRATLEHGHANDRADDWSSVAYWYQLDRTAALPPLPALVDREPPWPPPWTARVQAIRHVYAQEFAGPDDPDRRARFVTGVGYLTRAAHRRDWTGIDRALEWLTGAPAELAVARSAVPTPRPPGPLDPLRAATDAAVASWVENTGPAAVLDAVCADWLARFDEQEAGRAELTIGLRVTAAAAELAAAQIAIRGGSCLSRTGSAEPERLTVLADPLTLLNWTLGRLDPWEAALRGCLVVRGDGNLALRLPALFPPPTAAPGSTA